MRTHTLSAFTKYSNTFLVPRVGKCEACNAAKHIQNILAEIKAGDSEDRNVVKPSTTAKMEKKSSNVAQPPHKNGPRQKYVILSI